jgi:hypothetical protein
VKRIVKRVAIGIAVLLAFGAAGLMCQRVSERGRYVAAFSTYGAGPDGTRGLYLLADGMGARPRRWAEELGSLPEGGMLVALGSCDQQMRREVGRLEREELKRWIERGGVLLVAGVRDYVTMEGFGVELTGECRPDEGLIGMLARAEEDEDNDELEELPGAFEEDPTGTYEEVTEIEGPHPARMATGVAPPFGALIPVGLRRPMEIELADDARATTLLTLDGPHGAPAGVRVDIGRGSVIVLASGSMFSNADLRSQGGGVLFSRIVRDAAPRGPILFDEYHLGVGQRRSMMRYLRQIGGTAVVVQLLLLCALFIWRSGARFGAPKIEPPPEPAGTASYVDGVATLYSKARDPAGAGRIVIRRALARIAAHHHLGSADPARMAELLDERKRRGAAEAVRGLLKRQEGDAKAGLARLVEEVDALVDQARSD